MSRLHRLLRSRTATAPRTVHFDADPRSERQAQSAEAPQTGPPRADFTRVKIHADQDAASTVDSLGARALTWGRNIFFGPGEFAPHSARGRRLLAHETAHVAQQAAVNQPVVQFAPKDRKPGIGAGPPDEAFVHMKTPGAEKGFVLFGKDDATLPDTDAKPLLPLLAGYTQPVQVDLHGYASEEGPDEYNINLSAHRAAAVKQYLQPRLPPGSRIILYAHGESRTFGVRASNRRVGVWVGAMPAEAGFKPRLDLDLQLRLGGSPKPRFDLPVVPPTLVPRPPWALDPPLPSLRFDRALPSPGDRFQLDWGTISEPGAFRGQQLSGRDAASLDAMGREMYLNLFRLGLGNDLAQWWTNRVLSSGYEARLVLEHPSLLDLSEQEMRKFDPEFSQTVLPVLTPDTLNWLIKKTFKKDVDFRF